MATKTINLDLSIDFESVVRELKKELKKLKTCPHCDKALMIEHKQKPDDEEIAKGKISNG